MDETQSVTVFDSDQQQLGETYAHALIGLGQKTGATQQLLEQLSSVGDVLRKLPKLGSMLQSPQIAPAEKMKLLEKAFGGRIDGKLMNFLKIVLEKRRFDCLPAIQAAAKKIFDELSGRMQATITTAEPIDDEGRQRVEAKLAGMFNKQIQLATRTDPSIIGGMVVRVGDTVYDGSVKNQLNQVRARASQRAADAIRASLDRFMTR